MAMIFRLRHRFVHDKTPSPLFPSAPCVWRSIQKMIEMGYFSLLKTVLSHSLIMKTRQTQILTLTMKWRLNHISYKNDLNAFWQISTPFCEPKPSLSSSVDAKTMTCILPFFKIHCLKHILETKGSFMTVSEQTVSTFSRIMKTGSETIIKGLSEIINCTVLCQFMPTIEEKSANRFTLQNKPAVNSEGQNNDHSIYKHVWTFFFQALCSLDTCRTVRAPFVETDKVSRMPSEILNVLWTFLWDLLSLWQRKSALPSTFLSTGGDCLLSEASFQRLLPLRQTWGFEKW